MQNRHAAAAREARIELDEIGQLDADAAEADRETRRLIFRQFDIGAGAAQPCEKPLRPDGIEQFDRRQIERHLQRVARRHRALEAEIEILRRISAETHRPVIQHRFGMGDAELEGKRIDERLQRRAGRAQRLGHVDGAGARGRKIIRAADMGADFARRIVDDENGDGDFRAEPLRALMRQPFERSLPSGGEGQAMRAVLLCRHVAPPRPHAGRDAEKRDGHAARSAASLRRARQA